MANKSDSQEAKTPETTVVQNGRDFNDPVRRHPSDPDFVGQGLDMSVYGTPAKSEKK